MCWLLTSSLPLLEKSIAKRILASVRDSGSGCGSWLKWLRELVLCQVLFGRYILHPRRCIRGALKLDLSKNLVFCPNQVDPHPPPRKLGHPKLKKKLCFFCILGYSKHIIFSCKSHTFGVTDDFLCDFW